MKKSLFAILIIVIGVAVLFANLDIFNMRQIVADWWPLLLIAVGGVSLIDSQRNYAWPVFVMAMGALFLLNTLNVADIDVGNVIGPAIIIGIGITMLVGGRRSAKTLSSRDHDDITVIMSGTTSKNSSTDYTGCRATTVMGGIEMDISHAVIKKEAVINCFVLMGGIDLRVPENVIVKSRAACFLGGIEDKTNPLKTADAPVLYIDGTIIMGGIEVKR